MKLSLLLTLIGGSQSDTDISADSNENTVRIHRRSQSHLLLVGGTIVLFILFEYKEIKSFTL